MKRGLTEQARQLKNRASATVVEQFERQYDHSLKAFEQVDHSLAHQSALIFIKEVETNTSEPISCKAGCGACCHQPVFVSYPEFVPIRAKLAETGFKINKKIIQAQTDDVIDNVYQSLPVPARRCVFLNQEGSCGIYDVRPLACRRHNVYSNPLHCVSGATKEIRYDVSPRAEGHLSAYFAYYNGEVFTDQLLKCPELLVDTE